MSIDRIVLESPWPQDEFKDPAGEVRVEGGVETYHSYTVPGLIDHNTDWARAPEGFRVTQGDLARLTMGEADAVEVPTPNPTVRQGEYTLHNDREQFWPGVGDIPSTAPRKQEALPEGRLARLKAAAKAAGRFMLGGY